MTDIQSPKMVVISGPVASGKNAVLEEILRRESSCTRLTTATTRAPREGERDGIDYLFLSKEKFYAALTDGLIPEHRHVEKLDTDYGIYLPELNTQLATGKVVIATPDIIGARYLKEHYDALTLFVTSESIEETKRRITSRQHMSEHELAARLEIAEREIREYAPWYDHTLTNPDGKLSDTVDAILAIMREKGYFA
jgi:guanylate kinase